MIGHGQAQDIGLCPWCMTAVIGEHSKGKIHRNGSEACLSQIDTQVTRTCCEVENE
jgi:hypothetical protein